MHRRQPVNSDSCVPPPAPALQLLALVKEEIRGCSDVPRLFACATVLCHLLAGGKEVRAAGLRAALGLLIHRVPKVIPPPPSPLCARPE